DSERKRIAMELHDDLMQRLSLLSMKLISVLNLLPATQANLHKELTEIEGDTALILDDLRQIAYRIHPQTIDQLGLPVALKMLTGEVEKYSSISISLTV